MRYINIDLSSDNYLQEPQIFGGYAGEHNETILQVRIPDRMVDIECSGYRFDFQTSEDNKISSPLIPVSELNDGVLSFKLAEQLTVAGKLLFNIVAILLDENMVSLISKTNRVILHIEDSPEGNAVLIDPNGYKDELQKMVDERVSQIAKGEKGEKGEQGERGVSGVYVGTSAMPEGYNIQINPEGSAYELPVTDQTYNPESENAQSGVAVAEALEPFNREYELIETITIAEEGVTTITRNTEPNGNAYSFKDVFIKFSWNTEDTTKWILLEISADGKKTDAFRGLYQITTWGTSWIRTLNCYGHRLFLFSDRNTNTGYANYYVQIPIRYFDSNKPIDKIQIQYQTEMPVGTVIFIML